MDKGCDVTEIYKKVLEDYGVQEIILLNLRNSNIPLAGFIDFKGTPRSGGYWKDTAGVKIAITISFVGHNMLGKSTAVMVQVVF